MSFFLPSSLAPLFGVAGQISPILTCLQLKIPATHVSRRHKLTVRVAELQGSADRLFEVLQLPWMQSSKLRPICEATRHLAYALIKYADYLTPSTEIMPGIIYTTEYWIVNNTECDAALWMNGVW